MFQKYKKLLFKIAFYMTLGGIFILSVTPHPSSETVAQTTLAQKELSTLGSVAYVGEEQLGSFSDKYRHLIAFWTLALFLDLAYSFRTLYKFLFLTLYGVSIEAVQYFLPYRDFDIYDVTFNTIFIGAYFLLTRVVSVKLKKDIG
ncbi:MAG: VanZ family protein [Campylobacterota bacterium]|nr:VanZ family protein [Campylobacterota bacterium]